jgi:cell division protein FtsW
VVVQPSEIAKLALVLWGADLLARKHAMLHDPRHLMIPLLPVTAVLAGLIMLEPDLGTTLVILSVALVLLLQAGSPLRVFSAMLGVTAAGVTVLAVAEPYRMQRLMLFTHPFDDPSGAGYQMVHGLYALASGGLTGLGLGASREKWAYLPNAHTDYIFAIIGEELGLVGTCGVLALFTVLALSGFRIARRSTDRFTQLTAAAVTVWITAQALINIGAVTGTLPITGIPLPLLSYGSSAMVPNLAALGILAGCARSHPADARFRAQRRAERRRGR